MRFAVALRHQKCQGFSHGLRFGVAEDALRATVPAGDIARAVGGDDGIEGRLGDRAAAPLAGRERRGRHLCGGAGRAGVLQQVQRSQL